MYKYNEKCWYEGQECASYLFIGTVAEGPDMGRNPVGYAYRERLFVNTHLRVPYGP